MNKRGAAMVEMGDHIACNTVIQCLGGQQLFGSQIDFRLVLFGLCIADFHLSSSGSQREHKQKNCELHVNYYRWLRHNSCACSWEDNNRATVGSY